ncbi:MAG: class I SAM-dependent methyltransferase [Acidimicrobiales bacterium]
MSFGAVHVKDLPAFVAECDARGGIASPEVRRDTADFSLRFDTTVDTGLDGFDPAYVDAQIALYAEISGRHLDQTENERTVVDIEAAVAAANPYDSRNPMQIAPHVRTIASAVMASDLPAGARVLDMGCGWGLSTEVFAFSGCEIAAVDINPAFVEVVRRRAERRGYHVITHCSSFDDFASDEYFDLVFFYESLHHAVRPWDLLVKAADWLAPGGKLTIAGEPIQDTWWPQWGLRLDAESVYCIHKHGWFEAGWSSEFLHRCFRHAGLELTLLPGLGIGLSSVGVATKPHDGERRPSTDGLLPADPPIDLALITAADLGAELRQRVANRVRRRIHRS